MTSDGVPFKICSLFDAMTEDIDHVTKETLEVGGFLLSNQMLYFTLVETNIHQIAIPGGRELTAGPHEIYVKEWKSTLNVSLDSLIQKRMEVVSRSNLISVWLCQMPRIISSSYRLYNFALSPILLSSNEYSQPFCQWWSRWTSHYQTITLTIVIRKKIVWLHGPSRSLCYCSTF